MLSLVLSAIPLLETSAMFMQTLAFNCRLVQVLCLVKWLASHTEQEDCTAVIVH